MATINYLTIFFVSVGCTGNFEFDIESMIMLCNCNHCIFTRYSHCHGRKIGFKNL